MISVRLTYTGLLISLYFCSTSRTLSLASSLTYEGDDDQIELFDKLNGKKLMMNPLNNAIFRRTSQFPSYNAAETPVKNLIFEEYGA